MNKNSTSPLACPACGGDFSASDLLDGNNIVTCLSCGRHFSTSEILRKSSEVEVEEIRSNAYRDAEREKTEAYREAEAERTRAYRDIEEGKIKLEEERIRFEYKKIEDLNKEKQKNARRKVLKIVIPIVSSMALVALIIFLLYGLLFRGFNMSPDAIQIGVSYEDFEKMNYLVVEDILQEKGFTNIILKEERWNILKKSGEVKSVTIDGCSEYYGFSKFLPDDQVIIYYYK